MKRIQSGTRSERCAFADGLEYGQKFVRDYPHLPLVREGDHLAGCPVGTVVYAYFLSFEKAYEVLGDESEPWSQRMDKIAAKTGLNRELLGEIDGLYKEGLQVPDLIEMLREDRESTLKAQARSIALTTLEELKDLPWNRQPAKAQEAKAELEAELQPA
jgi:hypothetical protein